MLLGTLCKAADIIKEHGARRVFAFASHGVFSGPAATRIANSSLTELVVLDTGELVYSVGLDYMPICSCLLSCWCNHSLTH